MTVVGTSSRVSWVVLPFQWRPCLNKLSNSEISSSDSWNCSMRRFCMQSASKTVFAGMSDTVQTVFFEQMGVTLKNGSQTISILGQILLLIVWAVVVIAIAAAIAKRRKLKDR